MNDELPPHSPADDRGKDSPPFPSGWWIAPAVILGTAAWVAIIATACLF